MKICWYLRFFFRFGQILNESNAFSRYKIDWYFLWLICYFIFSPKLQKNLILMLIIMLILKKKVTINRFFTYTMNFMIQYIVFPVISDDKYLWRLIWELKASKSSRNQVRNFRFHFIEVHRLAFHSLSLNNLLVLTSSLWLMSPKSNKFQDKEYLMPKRLLIVR